MGRAIPVAVARSFGYVFQTRIVPRGAPQWARIVELRSAWPGLPPSDPVVEALCAKRLCKRDQARIRYAATDVIGNRPFAGVSDDIDYYSAAAPAHCRINLAREVDEAEQLQIPVFDKDFAQPRFNLARQA